MKRAGQSSLPGVKTDVAGDASERAGVASRPRPTNSEGQLDRANELARAREDGEREQTIATFCECAAIALRHGPAPMGEGYSAHDVYIDIMAELHRRYGKDDPRVVHHETMRGLR